MRGRTGLGAAAEAAQIVTCSGVDEARRLVGEMQLDEPAHLRALLFEVDSPFGDSAADMAHGGALDQLAGLIARGLVTVTREPLTPMCVEMPELYEYTPLELEPFQNEIDDGVSVLAEAEVERPVAVEVEVVITPAPVLELGGQVTPPPSTAP